MALTPKGRATRQRIVDGTATHLEGNETVTLDDVLAITGTSKGQLFHYFPGGKDELWLVVMQEVAARVISDQQPHLGDLTSWRSWERWRVALLARYRAQGTNCPLNTLANHAGSIPGSEKVTIGLLREWSDLLSDGIEALQNVGAARTDISAS